MPTPEWTHMIQQIRMLGDRRRAIADKARDLAQAQARRHHPDTNGEPLLIHNWGNDAARAVWRRYDDRMGRVYKYCDAAYHRSWVAARDAEARTAR